MFLKLISLQCILLGYVCEKITRKMDDYDTRMQLLPTLSQAVMMTNRLLDS